jgi:hypothetical protein
MPINKPELVDRGSLSNFAQTSRILPTPAAESQRRCDIRGTLVLGLTADDAVRSGELRERTFGIAGEKFGYRK